VPSVFLSYRRISDEHNKSVRDLGDRLEAAGITVVLDQFAQEREFHGGGPDEGWPRWCVAQAKDPNHKILIMASASWFKIYEGTETPAKEGLGAAAEAGVIQQLLYNRAGIAKAIRIVTFAELDHSTVPLDLQRYHRFLDPRDFAALQHWLTGVASGVQAVGDWPGTAPPITWVMADHDKVREAFAQLITADAPFRYLPVQGGSELGKSDMTKQLLGNALRCRGLACGRFDFKGTIDVESEFQRFVQNLGVPPPPAAGTLTQRFSAFLGSLVNRGRAALLIFDTFEAAGDIFRWADEHLLVTLIRAPWLRVVIVGQKVPGKGGKSWDAEASPTLVLRAPTPEQWLVFSKPFKPGVDLEFVKKVYEVVDGKPAVLAQVLGPPP